ncbi:MAG: YIP1 family protein [Planctomycetota bacterium]
MPQRPPPAPEQASALNPWFSIWGLPRATMRQIIATESTRLVPVLAMVAGVLEFLSQASSQSVGDLIPLEMLLAAGIPAAMIGGLVFLFVAGALVTITGRWLGGSGHAWEVRAALMWGQVPALSMGLLLIPALVIMGGEAFTSAPTLNVQPGLALLLVGMDVALVVGGVWAAVTLLKCVGEAHGFSAARAFWSLVLAAVVFVVIVAMIAHTVETWSSG